MRNAIQVKRLETAISYFTQRFYEIHNTLPTDKQIYTFLVLTDFTCAKEKGKPMFGLSYIKRQDGVELIDDDNIPRSSSMDLDFLSIEEKTIIDRIIESYDEERYKTLKAWQNAKENTIMNYMDEIEDEYLRDIYEGYLEIQELAKGG